MKDIVTFVFQCTRSTILVIVLLCTFFFVCYVYSEILNWNFSPFIRCLSFTTTNWRRIDVEGLGIFAVVVSGYIIVFRTLQCEFVNSVSFILIKVFVCKLWSKCLLSSIEYIWDKDIKQSHCLVTLSGLSVTLYHGQESCRVELYGPSRS